MCRLYGFRGSEPTKVECTLVYAQNALLRQSWADLRGVSHSDGWGIGYYRNGEAMVERRETAAFEDAHFSLTAERIYAHAVLAHVRLATVGGRALGNTHPFHHGRWLFAHNGTVREFDRLKRQMEAETDADLHARRRGTTDSEAVFYWLLTRVRGAAIEAGATGQEPLIRVMADAVLELHRRCEAAGAEKPEKLNLLLTDGSVLVATRWNNSLHWVRREGIHDCEICGIPHVQHVSGHPYRAVVIASEPISSEPWEEVPDGGAVWIDAALRSGVERM